MAIAVRMAAGSTCQHYVSCLTARRRCLQKRFLLLHQPFDQALRVNNCLTVFLNFPAAFAAAKTQIIRLRIVVYEPISKQERMLKEYPSVYQRPSSTTRASKIWCCHLKILLLSPYFMV